MTRALLTWDQEELDDIKAVLLDSGEWTEEGIESALFYKPTFFKYRVKRIAPVVPHLYWAVRAVYVTFGNKKDSQTGEPLFNDDAWTEANQLLDEIKLGFYTDPPETDPDKPRKTEWYEYHYEGDGTTIRTDRYGIKMLKCKRGLKRAGQVHAYGAAGMNFQYKKTADGENREEEEMKAYNDAYDAALAARDSRR